MSIIVALILSITFPAERFLEPTAASARAESVKIETPGGAVLAGEFVDAGRGAPAVLFIHMCRADAVDGWLPIAGPLQAAGITTLRVSPPGLGGSTNSRAGAPWVADAAAALAYLRSRVGAEVPIATAGASCALTLALGSAVAHPQGVRAVVLLSGPQTATQLEFVRKTPSLAVFSAASEGEPPSPEWARALKAVSAHPASRVKIFQEQVHGTDMFQRDPAFAREVAEWLLQRLKGEDTRR